VRGSGRTGGRAAREDPREEARADKKGTSSLTLEVYRHSWILVDVRLVD